MDDGSKQSISILVCNVDCIQSAVDQGLMTINISILVCNVDCIGKNEQKYQHYTFYFIAIHIYIKVTKAISHILYIKILTFYIPYMISYCLLQCESTSKIMFTYCLHHGGVEPATIFIMY